jgi:hypothetical protein
MLIDNVRTNIKEIRETLFSKGGRKIVLIVAVVLIGMLVFHMGVVVGSHRHFRGERDGQFGFRPAPGMQKVYMPRGFIQDGHGVVGVVQDASASVLTVHMRDGSTATVHLSASTAVRDLDGDASTSAIMIGRAIIVLGTPNDDGSISADLIRVVPSAAEPQQ